MTILLEHYEVIREIGVGGHAVVLLTRDLANDRQVVVKRMHDHLPKIDPTYERRFGREAEILHSIKHPNIVSILEYGGNAEDGLTLVMEYLPGGTLEEWMRSDEPATHARIVDIGVQLFGALEHAWELGVLHRDIKPANILFDAQKNPVLCDFGIAKFDDSTTLTGAGETLGTPAYMSPEQVQGKDLDFRSDLYGLGLILFELLEGYLPFRKGDAIATSLARITETLPELSVENTAFRRFISRALASQVEDRFGTFKEAANELARCLSGSQSDATMPLETLKVSEAAARFETRLDLPVLSSLLLGTGVHRNIETLTSMSGEIQPGIEDAAMNAVRYEKHWSDPVEIKPSFVTKLQIAIARLRYKSLVVFLKIDDSQVLLPRTRFVTFDHSGLAIIHLQVDARISQFSLVAYSPELALKETERRPVVVIGVRRQVD